MKIRTACPGCQTRYVLPSEGIPPEGRRVACRHCGQQWTIPHPGPQSAPVGATPAAARPAPPGPENGARILCCPHCDFHFVAASAKPLKKERGIILLAEDQAYFRTLIRESLGEGYQYLVAQSVEEARTIFESASVDLIVLDLNLQDAGDGEEILDFKPPTVPALVLTGDQDPDLYGDRWKKLQAKGATDLLLKGLNIREQISMKVTAILESTRASA